MISDHPEQRLRSPFWLRGRAHISEVILIIMQRVEAIRLLKRRSVHPSVILAPWVFWRKALICFLALARDNYGCEIQGRGMMDEEKRVRNKRWEENTNSRRNEGNGKEREEKIRGGAGMEGGNLGG